MKKIIYTTIAAIAISATACTDGNNDSQDNNNDTIATPETEVDSTALQEVTGVVVDGARRSIDLQVDNDTINFELDSSEDVSWEIGDTLTIRYYMTRESGDSVVEVLDHQ